MSIPYPQLIRVLAANDEPCATLTLQDQMGILVTQRGGRVFGPFIDEHSPALTWINPVLNDVDSFRAFREAGQWNLGGERVWIAPEIQYNVRDRSDFWGTMNVPQAMDPGDFQLKSAEREIVLSGEIIMPAYNLSSATAHVRIERRLTPAANPLRALSHYDALMDGVRYAGYQHTVALEDHAPDAPVSESWMLTQLQAGGTLLIPCTRAAESSTYFGDPSTDALAPSGGAYRIQITGQRQYKTGYKAAGMLGRMGYTNALPDGSAYLLARVFFNNPSAAYAEEVPALPGVNGHSVHVYNDGGQFGGNGEMEVTGQAIGGGTGRRYTHDAFLLYTFVGPADRVANIAEALLGVRP